ncbi:hypothetical protein, partial [Amycolatopsis lurida]|uniref:hypothetical protein n=1 Tax=Amycolatopsis lurida TaxID=31959 RepID=UPI003659A0AE
MSGIVTTGAVSWINSLSPQVGAALIAALAAIVGVLSTMTVGILGFRHARRVADKTLEGERQKTRDERRFGVYEDAVKFLLQLDRRRPANYNFWPEMSGAPAEPEIPAETLEDLQARLVAWASPVIRDLWEAMREADHVADVHRTQVKVMRGDLDLVPVDPPSPEALEKM